jgi:lipoprotein-anchoring transpeptidase ErfK/SrfK
MRLVPYDELAQLSPEVPSDAKHIHVDTATQSVTAFEGDTAVLTARCASGGKSTKTPLGQFQTFHKGPTIHMTNDGEAGAGHGYDLPGVPWVSFFTGTGVSFHGTYWHNDYGKPRSHGCVNLRPEDAKFLYRWTSPVVPVDTPYLYKPGEGTRVEIVSSNA